jgi:hypothetical protein
MSSDSEFGFRLVPSGFGWPAERRSQLQPGAPVGKPEPRYVRTKDSLGLVIRNCVSMVCTLAYRVSGLQIFSGASFDPMRGIGERLAVACLIDWYVMYVESQLSLIVKVLDVCNCVCMCLCSVSLESLLNLCNVSRRLIVMFVVLVEHEGPVSYSSY